MPETSTWLDIYNMLYTVDHQFTVHLGGKEICTVNRISVYSSLHIMFKIWED